ncbi:MAG: dihydropyrimidinase [Bacteroidales bacterium]
MGNTQRLKPVNYLLQNGIIVTSSKAVNGDLLISDGRIVSCSFTGQPPEGTTLFDCSGCYILPAGIDPHVHMALETPSGRSADDFYSGSKAALRGGTTTLIDFVTPRRGQSVWEAFLERQQEAKNALCNVRLHVSPVEWRETTGYELTRCLAEGEVNSFKVYMAYRNSIGLEESDIQKTLRLAAREKAVVAVHCEVDSIIVENQKRLLSAGFTAPDCHPKSRPSKAEAEAVGKIIQMAEEASCPVYLVHISARESLDLIHRAQQKGLPVYAETCPQYLLLNDSEYQKPYDQAAACVMSPPLRTDADREALWQALAEGIINTVGTDHCPFTIDQKRKGLSDFTKIPNGAGGVQFRLSLLFTEGVMKNRISPVRFAEVTSTNAARIFSLEERNGLNEGNFADILVWDPSLRETLPERLPGLEDCINIYAGRSVSGGAKHLFLSGDEVCPEKL